MSPWNLLGWLLLSLLCLLLAAGLYVINLLLGWPAWLIPALLGGCSALAFAVCFFVAQRKEGTSPSSAPTPLPLILPSRQKPRWLLLDFGGIIPCLPYLLEGKGSPLHPDGVGTILWSTPQANWLAVDATCPARGEENADTDTKKRSSWDALLALLDDRTLRNWLTPTAGIVVCLPVCFLDSGSMRKDSAAILLRLRDIRLRINDAPLWLILTGLEEAPGLADMARALGEHISLEHNPLHAPLGWFMPARRFWMSVSEWAGGGVGAGMARITCALHAFVQNAEAACPAPAGPALLLENSFRSYVKSLPSFAVALGSDLRGIFWAALPSASVNTVLNGPLFLRRLFQEILPEHVSLLPTAGARGRRFRLACLLGVVFLLMTTGAALYLGAENSRELLRSMARLESSLPHVSTIPDLNEMALSFQRLERECNGFARLYSAPHVKLAQLRVAIAEHLELPAEDTVGRWLNELRLWAGSRPGVESVKFYAPDGTVLARVDGAATYAGRQAAAQFIDAIRPLARNTQAVHRLQDLYDVSVFATWHTTGQNLLDAVQPAGIDPRTLLPLRRVSLTSRDMLGSDNPCAVFLKSAERELRFGQASVPDWVASLRDLHRIQQLAQLPVGTSAIAWSEAVSIIGEPPDGMRRALGNMESLFRARVAWSEYKGALAALSSEAGQGEGLVRLARALYGGDMNGGLRAADDAWQTLAVELEARHSGLRSDTLVLSLVRAPLLFVVDSATSKASLDLQERWSTEVVAAVEGLEEEALQHALVGERGLLHSFVADAAKPFMRASKAGFVPASALGRTFPLSKAFLHLLVETPQQMVLYPASYPVQVGFTPVTVNPQARSYPRGLSLRMDCTNAAFRSDVYNYQDKVLLEWSPEQCGGLTLAFLFDGFTADMPYEGAFGFARFTAQALAGPIEFVPADFPEVRGRLEALGITRLKTRFTIEGGEGVRDRLLALPAALMRNIVYDND